jgi:hypothetical protein
MVGVYPRAEESMVGVYAGEVGEAGPLYGGERLTGPVVAPSRRCSPSLAEDSQGLSTLLDDGAGTGPIDEIAAEEPARRPVVVAMRPRAGGHDSDDPEPDPPPRPSSSDDKPSMRKGSKFDWRPAMPIPGEYKSMPKREREPHAQQPTNTQTHTEAQTQTQCRNAPTRTLETHAGPRHKGRSTQWGMGAK